MIKSESWLVIPDIHASAKGTHDERSLDAVEQYARDRKFDRIVCLGDFLTMDSISRHNKSYPKLLENLRLADDYEVGNSILDRWQKLTKKVVLIEGNHEYWIEKYISETPQLEGMLEVEKGLNLKKRGIEWVRHWSRGDVYTYGNAMFVHGDYVNDLHAKKMVTAYGTNIFYGHTHDVQSYSMVTKGDNRTLVGQSLGCLALPQKYMRGAPSRHQQAFGEFHFRPDGYFTYYVPLLFNHKFTAPNGKVYAG